MFTQPCFIRKNTSELRKKLKNFGYKCNNGKWMGTYLATFRKKGENNLVYCGSPEYDMPNNPSLMESIDCGTNENLFLALAALRDDTDKNQWFVYDNSNWSDTPEIFYFICKENNIKDEMCVNLMYNDCHKATIDELIEHFKK